MINLDNLKSVWDKLHEMYKSVSDACIDTHLVRLQNLKMGNDEKVMSYVNLLVSMENDLAAIGHSIDEKEKKRSLLRGLREEFQTTAKVIRAVDMSFTRAVSELLIEEGSHVVDQSLSAETGTEAALATSEGGGLHCDHCGRDGHTIDYCFHNPSCSHYKKNIKYDFSGSKKPHPRRKHKRSSNNDEGSGELANIALIGVTVHENTDGKGANYALKGAPVMKGDAGITPQLREKWMIDSACTSHMCNDRRMFSELKKQPRHPVEVGERQLTEVAGIGTVCGTAAVDGMRQQLTLQSVLYVPTMMCNLFSVSKLRQAGCRVIFDEHEKDNLSEESFLRLL